MSEFKNLPSGWSKCELGEICKISSSKFDPTKSNEVKKCIELEHLSQKTGQILGFISSDEQKSIKNEFKKGQILYGKLRPYLQKFCQAKFDGVCSSEIWVLQGKNVTNDFLFYLVQSDKFNQIANKTSGTKMPRADWEYMSEMPFFIPPELEQKKIAEILSTWDEAINLTINLIENKKQFKKALMQNLLTAKIRFPQFKDEWRETKLNKICEIKKGEQLNKNILNNNIGFPVINGGIEPSGYTQKWNTEENTITISEGGNSCGYVNLLKEKFWSGGHCYTLLNLKIDKNFLYQYLKYNQDNIMKLRVGSGLPNIQKNMIENFSIVEPLLDEQQKIAEVLTACDDEINLLNLKLENLKRQKQGLMQQLLSGKVRVK